MLTTYEQQLATCEKLARLERHWERLRYCYKHSKIRSLGRESRLAALHIALDRRNLSILAG